MSRYCSASIKYPILFLFVTITLLAVNCKEEEKPILPPAITSFSPSSGLPGTAVTIIGTNFSSNTADNVVKFNDLVASVTLATPTALTVIVPNEAQTGIITVKSKLLTISSSTEFVVPPAIESFLPINGKTGSTVVIKGSGFSSTPSNNIVKIGAEVAPATVATSSSLTIQVPANAVTGKLTVSMGGHLATSINDFIVSPVFENFSPLFGAIGSTVVIEGSGFAPETTVKLKNISVEIISLTPRQIKFKVPNGATSGTIVLSQGTNTLTNNNQFNVVVEAVKAGGSGNDQGFAIAIDGQQNTYVSGRFSGTTFFEGVSLTSVETTNAFVAKYNPSNQLIWIRQVTGNSDSFGIAVDAAGNAYITGSYNSPAVNFGSITLGAPAGSGPHTYIAKLSPMGDFIWVKSYGFAFGWKTVADNLGHVYATGAIVKSMIAGSTTLVAGGDQDAYLLKIDATSGNLIWAKNFGGSSNGGDVAINSSGDIYFTGGFFETITFGNTTLTSAGILDGFVVKLSSSGSVLWAKQISGLNWDRINAVAINEAGDCYLAGYFSTSAQIGSVALMGSTQAAFVAKLNSNGDVVWAKKADSNFGAEASSVYCHQNNVYVTGYFGANGIFGSETITGVNNNRDMFVSKLSATGEFLWTRSAGGPENDYGQSLKVDSNGVIYTTGSFNGTATFGSTPLTGNGLDEIFIWKIWQQ